MGLVGMRIGTRMLEKIETTGDIKKWEWGRK